MMESALWIVVAVLIVGFISLISEIKAFKNTMIELTTRIAGVVDERHSQSSFDILRTTYPQYDQSRTRSGEICEPYRDEYSLNVFKPVSPLDFKVLFGVF